MTDIVLRTLVLYLLLTVCLRFMGKRSLGDLQPSEMVTTILISNIAVLPLEQPNESIMNGVVPIVVIAAVEMVFAILSLRFPLLRRMVIGTPIVIIRDGKLLQNNLRRLRCTIDDLYASMRVAGFFDITEIDCAIVETTGNVSFLPRYADKPVTAKMLHLKPQKTPVPQILISDGKMDKEYLAVVLGKAEGGTLEDLLFFDRGRDKSFVVKKEGRRGVKKASLEYVPLAYKEDDGRELTLVRIKLHTGRTHQIRVQMSNAGHPLLGDGKYGGGSNKCKTALHSYKITFKEDALKGGFLRKSPFAAAMREKADLLSSLPHGYPWDLFEE